MQFDLNKVKTTVDIAFTDVEIGDFGYFSNDIESLKRAVEKERTNLHVIYGRLDYCLEEKFERRFGTESGNFSLFYPMDKELIDLRY